MAPPDPLWYKDAVIYQAHVRSFFDSDGDGIGDFPGPDVQARLPAEPRHHLPLAAAVLPLAAPRRRVRHRGLPERARELRHARAGPGLHQRRARSADTRPLRARRQPHLGPAPVVPARPQGAGRDRPSAPSTCGATPTRGFRRRASSSRTPSARTGRGIRWRSSTTGTASSRTSRISTTTTRPSSTPSSTS